MKTIDKRTPAQRLESEWAQRLRELMDEWVDPDTANAGMTPAQLRLKLENAGVSVSLQTIYAWLRTDNGGWSPRPHHQAAIAFVLSKKVREVFPIEAVAS